MLNNIVFSFFLHVNTIIFHIVCLILYKLVNCFCTAEYYLILSYSFHICYLEFFKF